MSDLAMSNEPHPPLAFNEIEDTLDFTHKGMPAGVQGLTWSELGATQLDVLDGDCLFPVATLNQRTIRHNSVWMREFCELNGTELWPHGKTTMSPELFALQLADGARGITAATPAHVRTYAAFGIKRIFLANQLVGKANIEQVLAVLREDPEIEFYALADSVAGVEQLVRALHKNPLPNPVGLLVEIGATGARTGVREHATGLAVARAIAAAAPYLALRGVEAFEGVHQGQDGAAEDAGAMLERLVALARDCHAEELFGDAPPILTAGGSSFFDLCVLKLKGGLKHARVILRSGCYIIHDHGMYGQSFKQIAARGCPLPPGELEPSLEIWTVVQSVPEAGRAIAAMGKRDAGYDTAMPTPLKWLRPGVHDAPQMIGDDYQVTTLFDQHAYLDGPDMFAVGDLVGFGVSHPCTTFDKWRALLLVDDDYRVTGAIRTFF